MFSMIIIRIGLGLTSASGKTVKVYSGPSASYNSGTLTHPVRLGPFVAAPGQLTTTGTTTIDQNSGMFPMTDIEKHGNGKGTHGRCDIWRLLMIILPFD